MPYSGKLSSMTLFSSRIYRVSHSVLAGVLLDIWLGIVKQGGKRMHHYLLSMRKLLEKYYNINYYCTYRLLFFIFNRMLNPFYWLSLSKWNNRYINRCISLNKRQEAAGMAKGVDVYISDLALSTPITISFWIFSLVCLACIKIFKVELLSIFEIAFEKYIIILTSFLVAIGVFTYYVNKIFLFKNDKYEKYFAKFDKEKKYLLYYGIYVVSLIVQFATFYLLLSSA